MEAVPLAQLVASKLTTIVHIALQVITQTLPTPLFVLYAQLEHTLLNLVLTPVQTVLLEVPLLKEALAVPFVQLVAMLSIILVLRALPDNTLNQTVLPLVRVALLDHSL